MAYVWASRVVLFVGCLLIVAGLAYGGFVGFMMWREGASPSTSQVLVLKDGRRIPLVQPTAPPARQPLPTGRAAVQTPGRVDTAPAKGGTPSVSRETSAAGADTSPPYLPPLRLKIARIGVDWPVVLSTNEHMPKYKGVGWLMGSAYPGNAGNLVLFGHLDGPYATLERLHELQPGDEFSVTTEAGEYSYRVIGTSETTSDDVEVLAPTSDPTATLITCSGSWDTFTRQYSQRRIVTATMVGVAIP